MSYLGETPKATDHPGLRVRSILYHVHIEVIEIGHGRKDLGKFTSAILTI